MPQCRALIADSGTDRSLLSGLYAKALMREANNVAKSTQLEFVSEPISNTGSLARTRAVPGTQSVWLGCPSPRELLRQAFRHVEKQAIIGSTTATVACLKENRLQIANLGESLRAGYCQEQSLRGRQCHCRRNEEGGSCNN